MALRVGDKAPDFSLPQQDGSLVRLTDVLKRGPAVVYFYPKDETAGCTKEACAFRDAYEDFKTTGAEIIGISADSTDSHASFASHRKLPFLLLSDPDRAVHALYDIRPVFLGLVPGRVTFVIDAGGTIRHVFDSAVNMTKHVSESLKVLRELRSTTEHSEAGAQPARV
jgi:peroxiredoxin Q/BCP